MISEDVEMLMGHCRCSLSANGELLGAMIRIKNFVEEAQKTPNNIKLFSKYKKDLKEYHRKNDSELLLRWFYAGSKAMHNIISKSIKNKGLK